MNIVLDTNIVLDVLLNREPWVADSKLIWQACDSQEITGHMLASTLTDIFYIAKKLVDQDTALQAVKICLTTFVISPIDRSLIEHALMLKGNDFEDNVQLAAAEVYKLDGIVTRNPRDFGESSVAIFTPQALLAQLTAKRRD